MILPPVRAALDDDRPVVALESAVLTHGLPRHGGLDALRRMEEAVRESGAVPAVVALLEGDLRVGLTARQLERLHELQKPLKVGLADLAAATASGSSGGTTVAATAFAAARAGIEVMTTGGIGGVHRSAGGTAGQEDDGPGWPPDISGDLPALARWPVAVVCSGPKAVLDLPATLELLETLGVPVAAFGTDELPGFYTRETGLSVEHRVDTPEEAAELIRAQWSLGLSGGILLAHPPPAGAALDRDEVEGWIDDALARAGAEGVRGKAVTPFLLSRVDEASGGRARRANLALLEANARLAGRIASSRAGSRGSRAGNA